MTTTIKATIFCAAALAATWLTLTSTLQQMTHHRCQQGSHTACAHIHS